MFRFASLITGGGQMPSIFPTKKKPAKVEIPVPKSTNQASFQVPEIIQSTFNTVYQWIPSYMMPPKKVEPVVPKKAKFEPFGMFIKTKPTPMPSPPPKTIPKTISKAIPKPVPMVNVVSEPVPKTWKEKYLRRKKNRALRRKEKKRQKKEQKEAKKKEKMEKKAEGITDQKVVHKFSLKGFIKKCKKKHQDKKAEKPHHMFKWSLKKFGFMHKKSSKDSSNTACESKMENLSKHVR